MMGLEMKRVEEEERGVSYGNGIRREGRGWLRE